MTLDFLYFGIKKPFTTFYCRKQTVISMCFTLGVTLLASTTRIQRVLSYQCTVVAPVWSAKYSMYIRITLIFLTALYMYLIPPSVGSKAIAGWVCNFLRTETPSRVWIMPKTDCLLLIIISWPASWWNSKHYGLCIIQLDSHSMEAWWPLSHHNN